MRKPAHRGATADLSIAAVAACIATCVPTEASRQSLRLALDRVLAGTSTRPAVRLVPTMVEATEVAELRQAGLGDAAAALLAVPVFGVQMLAQLNDRTPFGVPPSHPSVPILADDFARSSGCRGPRSFHKYSPPEVIKSVRTVILAFRTPT
ncbi:hypothetical protein M446_6724 [Methylobacterium sp. 4-46]|uniref:hypothetical protein n=1 Tax=unclassified Methylobacterium TaxID=2615210 RepID=UPI000165CD04|nr:MULTISPECIES: hypothetical protein [Methylobacterium]ACA20974.1 hypothetical protein M446_6724 [Methylobacterium sp. 4-46]WFT80130.1 hypothetical protein QA634_33965 [Methylobacterium nodulans]